MSEEEKKTPEADESRDEEKVHIDDDDILAELGLTDENKAELDSDGILEKEDTKEKAVLDKDGIFEEDEAISVDSEPEQPQPEETPGEQEKTVRHAGGFFQKYGHLFSRYCSLLKKIPFKKAAFIGGGTVVLALAGWMVLSYLFFAPAEESVPRLTMPEHEPEQGIRQDISQLSLEPFLVPLIPGTDNNVHFLRVSVIIGLGYNAPQNMEPLIKKMRLTIYGFLSEKRAENFSDENQKRQIKRSLVTLLNRVLQKDIIRNVEFKTISLV